MPQVDKATFYTIIYSTFLIYVGGYLFLNLSVLFRFIAATKTTLKRLLVVQTQTVNTKQTLNAVLLFP